MFEKIMHFLMGMSVPNACMLKILPKVYNLNIIFVKSLHGIALCVRGHDAKSPGDVAGNGDVFRGAKHWRRFDFFFCDTITEVTRPSLDRLCFCPRTQRLRSVIYRQKVKLRNDGNLCKDRCETYSLFCNH